MAPRTTRSKAAAKAPVVKGEEEALKAVSGVGQKNPLQPPSQNPPKLFVLPKDTSADAKIITLAHPRYREPTRYFACPKKGFYEFKKIAAPKNTPRSWLLTPSQQDSQSNGASTGSEEENKENGYSSSKGYIMSDAFLYIATPIDPLFLVLPALAAKCTEEKQHFLEADDHFDVLITSSPHLRPLLQDKSIRKMFETRMAAICDTVDAGDETMYRLNQDKVLKVLGQKCRAMVDRGLPASLEDVRVRKALEVPLASIKRELTLAEEDEVPTPKTETDSQISLPVAESFSSVVSEAPTAVTTPEIATPAEKEPIDAPAEIVDALRMQTAFMFLLTSYIPKDLGELLTTKLASSEDFPNMSALTDHLANLKKLRDAAALARSLGDFSHKREYDEEGESRKEKKRKLEEEEKLKKKNMSQGVKKLMKADVSGMKKMSDFFKKKA